MHRPHSSRQRYLSFVQGYKQRRLDDIADSDGVQKPQKRTRRREYLREYVRWLRPHALTIGGLLLLALGGASLEMIQPLFMRYIIDRVLLVAGLSGLARITRLNMAGLLFVGLVVASNLIGALRDYRQRLLNGQLMLALRRSLFDRMLHLPLPKLWDMKTGGILSRLTGDVDTTTGLLQMAMCRRRCPPSA